MSTFILRRLCFYKSTHPEDRVNEWTLHHVHFFSTEEQFKERCAFCSTQHRQNQPKDGDFTKKYQPRLIFLHKEDMIYSSPTPDRMDDTINSYIGIVNNILGKMVHVSENASQKAFYFDKKHNIKPYKP